MPLAFRRSRTLFYVMVLESGYVDRLHVSHQKKLRKCRFSDFTLNLELEALKRGLKISVSVYSILEHSNMRLHLGTVMCVCECVCVCEVSLNNNTQILLLETL